MCDGRCHISTACVVAAVMTNMKPQHPMVVVRSLRKTWPGGVEAIRGIDFDVMAGEVFGLLGPNGAGKSTTIGVLTTAVSPTSGHALVDGFDVAQRPIKARSVSGLVFQEAVVDHALTGRS